MEIEDVIAERDEAKAKAESHEQEAAHYRKLYDALDTVVRLKTAERAASNGAPCSNGHTPAPTTRVRDLIIQVVKKEEGLTVQEIREKVAAQRAGVKPQYIYNLLTELYQAKVLDREEGRYYEKKD